MHGTGFLRAASLLVLLSAAVAEEAPKEKEAERKPRLAYQEAGKSDAADARPVLLFIHGWSCDRTYWREQLGVFAKSHRVLAVDLAGHGASEKLDHKKWTISGLAGDVVELIRVLDLRRVILIGHSMGGPVAVEAARATPRRTVGVIGVDTLHNADFRFPEVMVKSLLQQYQKDFPGTAQRFARMMFPPDADPKLVDWVGKDMGRAYRPAALGLFADFGVHDVRPGMKELAIPIRCINAAGPQPTLVATNRKYARRFDAVIMKGVGHFLMLEKPRAFNDHLAEAVAAVTRPRAPVEKKSGGE